jgi:hypothetical protein
MNVVRSPKIKRSFVSDMNVTPLSYRYWYFLCNFVDAILRSLQDSLAVISVELTPIYEKLVTTRRQLVALAAKEGSHKAELKPIQEELRKIDSLSTHFTL